MKGDDGKEEKNWKPKKKKGGHVKMAERRKGSKSMGGSKAANLEFF